MKIVQNSVDQKSHLGHMKLIPNNADDIYRLSSIIRPNDRISSFTTRKVSLDGGKTQKKITLKLEIKVESLDADLHVGILYVKGKTSTENEHVRVGSYHTLDVAIGDEFIVFKSKWSSSDLAKIKDSAKEVPEICFIVFYERDCVVSTVSSNEARAVYKTEVKGKNFKDLVQNSLKLKQKVKNYIIASSSEIRNDFFKALVKDDSSIAGIGSVLKLTPEYKGLPNSKVISKILSDPNMASAINNIKFVEDIREMQNTFNKIDSCKDDICIGIKEVSEAIDYGAINMLFVTDKFSKPISLNERTAVDGFLDKVRELRAKICVIPVSLDAGERLDAMGGVVCSLKFNYK